MKKIVSIIIAVLLFIPCFSFTAFGEELPFSQDEMVYTNLPADAKITFSEDFKTLYCGEHSYTRCNTNSINADVFFEVENEVVFDNEEVSEIYLTANLEGNLLDASIEYTDGAELLASYIRDDYLEEYNILLKDGKEEYTIDFFELENNIIKVDRKRLFGKKTKLRYEEFAYWSDCFYVSCDASDGSFGIEKGCVYAIEKKFYYLDFAESGLDYESLYEVEEYDTEFTLYEIQDTALIEQIEMAMEEYYGYIDFGVFMDDELSEKISKAFFVILLIILPFAILVAALIFAFRSKKIYKKMFFVISALSAAEVVIFTIVSIVLLK